MKSLAPHQRPVLALLLAIIALGAGLRGGLVLLRGQDAPYSSMILNHANLAMNIARGDGYQQTTNLTAHDEMNALDQVVLQPVPSFADLNERHGEGHVREVDPQILPGYPYFAAAVWVLTPGGPSYTTVQITTGLLDGILGPLAVWTLLGTFGCRRAALFAAFGYAVQPILIYQSTRFMPDALSALVPLCAVAILVAAINARRDMIGAALAGGLVGAGIWLRGDFIAVAGMLVVATVLFAPRHLPRRVTIAAVLGAASVVPMMALTAFYTVEYGEFHATRPGAGLLLWEGVAQNQPNPWGIEVPPAENLDWAAGQHLASHGYNYGTWEGDSFLVRETIRYVREEPAWYATTVALRALRVMGMRIPEGPTWLLVGLPLLIAPVAVVGFALLWRRARFAAAVLLALFASRVIPFSFMYDQFRFVVLLPAIYSTCMAVALDALLLRLTGSERLWPFGGSRDPEAEAASIPAI